MHACQCSKGARPKLVRTNEPTLSDRSSKLCKEEVVKKEETPEISEVSEVVIVADPKKEVVVADTTACNAHRQVAFTIDQSPASPDPDPPSSPEVWEDVTEKLKSIDSSIWTPKWLESKEWTPRRRQHSPEVVELESPDKTPASSSETVTLGSLEVMPFDLRTLRRRVVDQDIRSIHLNWPECLEYRDRPIAIRARCCAGAGHMFRGRKCGCSSRDSYH